MPLLLNRYLECQKLYVRLISTTGYERLDKLLFTDEPNQADFDSDDKLVVDKQNRARSIRVLKHFTDQPHLRELKEYIPSKYFVPKRRLTLQHLYLLDRKIAKSVAAHMLPYLRKNKKQLICETNAGLGLISAELLDSGIKSVRLYESCPEFSEVLQDFNISYRNRVELFYRDLFHLSSFSNSDKYDYGNRVSDLLKGIPKRNWNDDPVLTVVGPMPDTSFISYLIRMLTMQREIIQNGRIQIFALMRPREYLKLTATPEMKLHTYQVASVLFQLFFDCKLIEKYPRESFLPWETRTKLNSHTRPHSKVDLEYIYLVRINFKKNLPAEVQHLLHLYYFIKQGFLKGTPKVIPTIEKWLPRFGVNLIVPEEKLRSFPNMGIFTEFGELNPTQILEIFLEMVEHPEYNNSPFIALIESQLLKTETIDGDLADTSTNVANVESFQENVADIKQI